MKGYKFTTEQEAQSAIELIEQEANLPKGDNVTQTWTSYAHAEFNSPEFYYIRHDDLTERVLGLPEDLTIVYDESVV